MRILIAEDERRLAGAIARGLRREGMAVDITHDGASALVKARVVDYDVVVYVGPGCHLVQYPLRRGEMFNQVAVFRSARALAGVDDWGTPDELDAAFADTCDPVRAALPHLWRDRWWRMFDREPIGNWIDGRLALTGDAAHPMLQYLAQGACQALEDAARLAECVGATTRFLPETWLSSTCWAAAAGPTLRTAEPAMTARPARPTAPRVRPAGVLRRGGVGRALFTGVTPVLGDRQGQLRGG